MREPAQPSSSGKYARIEYQVGEQPGAKTAQEAVKMEVKHKSRGNIGYA